MLHGKYSVHQCVLAVRENLMRTCGATIDEAMIERILRTGKAEVGEKYMAVIRQTAEEYIGGIFRKLREHEYNPEMPWRTRKKARTAALHGGVWWPCRVS